MVARAIVENAIETSSTATAAPPSSTHMPLVPPSSEMRSYAYSLMASPSPTAISPSPMGLPQSTPTPVKLTMDADSVLTGSPVEDAATSPLTKGVDNILIEGTSEKEIGTGKSGAISVWFVVPVVVAVWAIIMAVVPLVLNRFR